MSAFTVWKYKVPHSADFTIDMPQDAKVLDVQMQHGRPVLWALVTPSQPTTERRFILMGTGHIREFALLAIEHVATFQDGDLVWHVFEVLP